MHATSELTMSMAGQRGQTVRLSYAGDGEKQNGSRRTNVHTRKDRTKRSAKEKRRMMIKRGRPEKREEEHGQIIREKGEENEDVLQVYVFILLGTYTKT